MNIMWIKITEGLPPVGKYVLVRHNREWEDSQDSQGASFVVAKMNVGISAKERAELPDGHARKRIYKSSDEHGNNRVAYDFEQYGPGSFFGQEITHWMIIPDINANERDSE